MSSSISKQVKFAAAILAGGKASRYGGTTKGLLEVAPGVTIARRLIGEVISSGVEEIAILANDSQAYQQFGLPVIPDLRQGVGPLGGVEAALDHYEGRCEAVVFLPCDLPGIGSSEIEALLAAYQAGDSQIVYAKTERFFSEPLCAVVHNDLRGAVSSAIDQGHRKVRQVWRELGAQPVHFDDARPFFNVNTPEDMADWLDRMKDNSDGHTICAPEDMIQTLADFIEGEGLRIRLVSEGESTVSIARPDPQTDQRVESDVATLQIGGWIKCPVARSAAKKLNMSTRKMGKLLDLLDIKVRECGLGCF